VSAIFALDDLPEKWKQYTEINAKHYNRCPDCELDASVQAH